MGFADGCLPFLFWLSYFIILVSYFVIVSLWELPSKLVHKSHHPTICPLSPPNLSSAQLVACGCLSKIQGPHTWYYLLCFPFFICSKEACQTLRHKRTVKKMALNWVSFSKLDWTNCCISYFQVPYDHFTSPSVYSCIICYLNISCLQSASHLPCFCYKLLCFIPIMSWPIATYLCDFCSLSSAFAFSTHWDILFVYLEQTRPETNTQLTQTSLPYSPGSYWWPKFSKCTAVAFWEFWGSELKISWSCISRIWG